jgi:hypothetical protein
MIMPQSDRLLEDVYSFINKVKDEPTRLELTRVALLAVQYRANQIKQKRLARAAEQRKAERIALSSGASRDQQQRAGGDDRPAGAVAPGQHAR